MAGIVAGTASFRAPVSLASCSRDGVFTTATSRKLFQTKTNKQTNKQTVYDYSVYCSHSTMLATAFAMMAATAIRKS